MSPRPLSVAAFILMVAGIAWLFAQTALLSGGLAGRAVQAAAAVLMIWARLTFGRRSFHAAANPTGGGLVTTGPYRYLRHPIYAAVIYFVWAAALDRGTAVAVAAAVLVTAGAALRIGAEEQLLLEAYPEYRSYRTRTARIVPFLI